MEKGKIVLCLTKAIAQEYIEVLSRLGLQQEKELEELLGLFARGFNTLFSATTPTLRIIDRDPSDDKFIECTVALKAAFIISGDRHLLDLGDYMGIKIVSPRDFLESFARK